MNLFEGTYEGWRKTRIEKLENIFGKEFFNNKTILELGCGYGHTGKYFTENLNAKLTLCEGDPDFIDNIKSLNPNSEVICLDQDKEWNLNKKFDVIIHWGVLYHLDNWKQDLKCTLNHTDLLFLESEVADSDDPSYEFKFEDHDGYDQAVNKKATRPSASFIEKFLDENNFDYHRYDDSDINYHNHKYDWKVTNVFERREDYGRRRFWIAKRKLS